jgi:hypothetical protein
MKSFYKRNGNPLTLNALANFPLGTEYQAFSKKCCHLLAGSGSEITGIDEITFEILDWKQFNASACKLGPRHYYIGVARGLIDEVFCRANNPRMHQVFHAYVQPKHAIEFKQFIDCTTYYIYCAVLYHELAHIIRGHIDMMASKHNQGFIEEISAANPHLPGPENPLRKAMESDADGVAARLLLASIHEVSEGMAKHYRMNRRAYWGYNYASASTAVAWLFHQIAEGRQGGPNYPWPATRQLGFMQHFVDQQRRDKTWNNEVAAAHEEGQRLWYLLADGMGWSRHDDLDDLVRWEQSIRPVVIQLERELPQYAPCQKRQKTSLVARWKHQLRTLLAALFRH